MNKLERSFDCMFCKRIRMSNDGYIIHLKNHIQYLANILDKKIITQKLREGVKK